MENKERIFKLKGVAQHYAWGGNRFIPELLGMQPDLSKPSAEYRDWETDRKSTRLNSSHRL